MANVYARWSKISRRAKGQYGRKTSTKLASGQTGRSSVAAAAYAAGVRLKDERTGKVHDFRAKSGVIESFIVGGGGWGGSDRRAELWNAMEAAETRCNSNTAREMHLALPHELTHDQRSALCRQIAQDMADQYGTVVDVSLHMPNREGDQRNYHAHFIMTARSVNADGSFGAKTVLDRWGKGRDAINEGRAKIEQRMNDALADAGFGHIKLNFKSYKKQGLDKRGQIKEGSAATNARRNGAKLNAERQGKKTIRQINEEAGAIAAFADAERLRSLRAQLAANEKALLDMKARAPKYPRVRGAKVKMAAGRKGSQSVESFMARVMALIAAVFGSALASWQQGMIAAHVMEETAGDMKAARAIRDQNRVLRRQINRLETQMMKDKKTTGKSGEGAKAGASRLRRRRHYDQDVPIAAKVAGAENARRRPQQKPPHVYAAGAGTRKRPQKARYEYMRASKNHTKPDSRPKS